MIPNKPFTELLVSSNYLYRILKNEMEVYFVQKAEKGGWVDETIWVYLITPNVNRHKTRISFDWDKALFRNLDERLVFDSEEEAYEYIYKEVMVEYENKYDKTKVVWESF